MPIDSSIPLQIQPIKLDNPVNKLAQMLQLQDLMNKQSLFPLEKQKAELALTKAREQNNLLTGLFSQADGGDDRASTALAIGAVNGSVGPTVANAQLMDSLPAPKPGAMPGLNINSLSRLAATGYDTKNLFDLYKYQTDGVKREAGAFYKNPLTGNMEYVPDVKNGLNYNPQTGSVSVLPGFSQANASIKAAETNATEGAKANWDLLPLGYVDQSGRPIGGSKGAYLGAPSPGAQDGQSGSNGMPLDFKGADLLMQIPPADRQKIIQGAMQQGNHQFSVNYRLPNGKVLQGDVDLNSGGVPQFLQDRVDYIRSQATPEERKAMISNFVKSVQSRVTDPEDLMHRLSDFWTQLNAPPGTPVDFSSPQSRNKPADGMPVLQSEAEKKQQLGQIELSQGAQGEVNKNWIANVHTPVVKAANDAQGLIDNLATLRNINPQTGWGSEAQAQAANVLVGLGIGGKQAEKMATDYQKFQSVAMEKLWQTLNAAKGPQTEGDADRAKSTFAQYANTGQANQFIMDVLQAKANQDIKRGQYYQEALPLAIQSGDLTRVDREWNKIQPSIWSDPILQKYVKKGGK